MAKYRYTLLKQDGSKVVLPASDKKDFKELREILRCGTIELIPQAYYPDEYSGAEIFGDEEARFNSESIRNPHMKVLRGNLAIGETPVWDCVGDLIVEEEI